MTRDDILRMKEEAELWAEQELQCIGEYHPDFHDVADVRFAALVAAAEREACAKVCEEWGAWNNVAADCAAAIRTRGDKPCK